MARIRFPPRSDLPRTVPIKKVSMVGDTWYERGVRYWFRRVGAFLLMALVLALATTTLWEFFAGLHETSVPRFYIVLSVEIAYSLAIIAGFFAQVARRWNDPLPATPKRVRVPGDPLRTLVRTAVFLGALVIAIGSVACLGTYVVLLLLTLMPETVWERPARLRMAEELRSRGFDIS
jgi:hypothetical protein